MWRIRIWLTRSMIAFGSLGFLAVLVACGGGGGNPWKTMSLVKSDDGTYAAILGASGARVEDFRAPGGNSDQFLYTNDAQGEKVRVMLDANGLPQRLINENDGTSLVVRPVSATRVDFLRYDSSNRYLDGYAVVAGDGALSYAPILGMPSFTGQLVGQISGATQTASFAMLPSDMAGLGPLTAIPPEVLELTDAVLNNPISPAGDRSLRMKATIAGVDSRAVIGGLIAGAVVGIATQNPAAAMIAVGVGAYATQRFLGPLIDVWNDGEFQLEDLPERLAPILNGFNENRPAADSLQASLSGEHGALLVGTVLARALDLARDTVSAVFDRSLLPAVDELPPAVDTDLSGVGVDQQGVDYTYIGGALPNGQIFFNGSTAGGQTITGIGTIDAGGQIAGSVTGALGNGSFDGNAGSLGDCQTLQQSGGQGTFSYAFDAQAIAGTVQFSREAYNIPDGFRVISNGVALYDTGGPVSGYDNSAMILNGSRVLFVTVNAPTSGTAWEFVLGCPA